MAAVAWGVEEAAQECENPRLGEGPGTTGMCCNYTLQGVFLLLKQKSDTDWGNVLHISAACARPGNTAVQLALPTPS